MDGANADVNMAQVRDLQASLFPICTKGSFLNNLLNRTLRNSKIDINADGDTRQLDSKLRDVKEVFPLMKEVDCPYQAARWPMECQVLDDPVVHIHPTSASYSEKEPLYKFTGKEIQPKQVGEDSGEFCRSAVGGSACSLAHSSQDPSDLIFESRFESGNLAKVVKITSTYYELSLRSDMYTNRHTQWFYFRIENTKKNIKYRFSIVNMYKSESLFTAGMKPLLYSTKDASQKNVGWRRCGESTAYYKNDAPNGDSEDNPRYIFSFLLEFPHDMDTVYLAYNYPYTYTDLQDYLIKLKDDPVKAVFTKLRVLCRTLAGNNVHYLTVTEPCQEEDPKQKKVIVLTARVHPSETPSSWMMKGFIDFLTSDSLQAKELRNRFIFKLIPMLNPDGVVVGNSRCSLNGRDLNRQYRSVIRDAHPVIWHTKLMLRRLIEERQVVMFCDLHAHSRKSNIFMYGCEGKGHEGRKLQEQIFPLLLHKNAPEKFSFEDCNFNIQRSKENTARVVVWLMGVENSYTMEASFCGSSLGSRANTHLTIKDFEDIGQTFCETLLDYYNEDPRNEKMKLKICSRLMEQGSNAEQPKNIDISDYSSDESSTSVCEEIVDKLSFEEDVTSLTQLSIIVPPSTPVVPKRKSRKKKRKSKDCSTKIITL
ncbi:cytosolic carboxypeptidase Nna1-like isoform X1 [Aphis craccivora]|uniref:Cytosolic carboxypeptidase Nna1-like isoform X1 n=1 Tax=Aphis craccivora TaxID=307492 RepID=A0A6G0ZJW6_APHCR|nr:cytosolic carboxypeptidase Nna1-like isoform X1 [Aphis craccivora]